MNRVLEIREQQPYFIFQSPPPPSIPSSSQYSSSGFNLNNKVSPSILLVIIIIAIIFFISGLLHLLVRFLLRPPNRDTDELENVTALQGQLQQLFHLHDSGVDQSFIDTLPIFNYKAIIGVKDPFDCAVCLCEFEGEDKLRLLPKCSHAFHMDCIDTWLLSHSTCPLCRASLLPDFSANNANCSSPIVLVLESGGDESSREIVSDREEVTRVNPQMGPYCDDEGGDDLKLHHADLAQDSCDIHEGKKVILGCGEKVVSVKLGKFKNIDNGREGGCTSSSGDESNADARRCFSMGSFAYVMDENLSLQVPIRNTPMKKQRSRTLTPGHRQAMSECGFNSRVEFNGYEAFRILEFQGGEKGTSVVNSNGNGNEYSGRRRSKRESFSVSKIWLRGDRKDRLNGVVAMESSRRAVSFRFPTHPIEFKAKNGGGCGRTNSEIGISRGGGNGIEDEIQSCNSLDSDTNAPSFAWRTLLWLMGRQNKVVHPSFSANV